jgi:hypothetical protein
MMKTCQQTDENSVVEQVTGCAGFHDLLDWQIIQYRHAVNDYRLELSKTQHRFVPWKEAEREFSKKGLEFINEHWRMEYCGVICAQRKKCLLAVPFLRARSTESFHQVG